MSDQKKTDFSGNHTVLERDESIILTRLLVLSLLLFGIFMASACNVQPSPTASPASATPISSPTLTSIPATPTRTPTITPQPTSSLGVKAAELDGVTLSFWHPWTGDTGNTIQKSIEKFNASNAYGITVESISQGDLNSLYEKIDLQESKTGLPNLAVGANYQIQSWISAGKPVVGLDDYLDDPEWGLSKEELADFNELFLQQDVMEGSRIGMPAVRTAQVMYYNTTWAEELGFRSIPKDPEEFKTQVCAAAQANRENEEPEDDGTGGWLINTNPLGILSWLYAFGSQVLLPNDAGYNFNTSESESALLFLKDLIDEGCAFEALESPSEAAFANRQALIITSSLSDIGFENAEFERAENNDEWTVVGFPSPDQVPVSTIYGPSLFMFAGTQEENLATWLLIKWLLSPEQDADLVTVRGTFPIRTSTLELLADYADQHPQWTAAQGLLEHASPEPGLKSWDRVRWILGDVGTQIFRYYFTPDRIPATLELMDETAAELHNLDQ